MNFSLSCVLFLNLFICLQPEYLACPMSITEEIALVKRFGSCLAGFRVKFPQDLPDLLNEFQEILVNAGDDLEWLFWVLFGALITNDPTEDAYFNSSITLNAEECHLRSIINAMNQYFSLQVTKNEEITQLISQLPTQKWSQTKSGITQMTKVDSDAMFRSPLSVSKQDLSNDELFFQLAFHLIMSNDFAQLKEVCELTSNFEFWALVQSHPTLAITSSNFKQTYPLWRRTMYRLTQNTQPLWQRACYGLLCGDLESTVIDSLSFEEKFYCHLNNSFQTKLDSHLGYAGSLPSPPLSSESIDDILQKLSKDQKLQTQMKNPIRVLYGSLISDNLKSIIQSSVVPSEQTPLRLITHLTIMLNLHFGFDDRYLTVDQYISILKTYTLHLSLNKLYYQMPIYMSFIPGDDYLVEVYKDILSSSPDQSTEFKSEQIKSMRILNLPLEAIIRSTLSTILNETEKYYIPDQQMDIILDYSHDDIDSTILNAINWFSIANMIQDCISCLKISLRRFLSCGKIGACLIGINDLQDIIQRANLLISDSPQNDLIDEDILEIIQYHRLIDIIRRITRLNESEDNNVDINEISILSDDMIDLTTSWLLNLCGGEGDAEDKEFFIHLRKLYLPMIIETNISLISKYNLSANSGKQLSKIIVGLTQVYDVYDKQGLRDVLNMIADLSCDNLNLLFN